PRAPPLPYTTLFRSRDRGPARASRASPGARLSPCRSGRSARPSGAGSPAAPAASSTPATGEAAPAREARPAARPGRGRRERRRRGRGERRDRVRKTPARGPHCTVQRTRADVPGGLGHRDPLRGEVLEDLGPARGLPEGDRVRQVAREDVLALLEAQLVRLGRREVL